MASPEQDGQVVSLEARAGLAGSVAFGAFAVGALALSFATGSLVGQAAAVHALGTALAFFLGWLVARRRQLTAARRDEAQRLSRREASAGDLFRLDATREATALESFERWAFPAFACAYVLFELAAAGYLLSRAASGSVLPAGSHALPSSAVFAALAFFALLLGRYLLALAAGRPLLFVAGARRSVSMALVLLGSAAALAYSATDAAFSASLLVPALGVVELVLGLETLVLLFVEAYRPRRRTQSRRAAFESRLLALLAEPHGVARSFAAALDYQFGFELSKTWSLRLLARATVPLLLATGSCLWLLSALHLVSEHEQAWVERFGRRVGATLLPGLHVTFPWPVDRTISVPVARVEDLTSGGEDHDSPGGRFRTRLFSTAHAHDARAPLALSLVTRPDVAGVALGDVDLLAASPTVRFRRKPEPGDVAADPEHVLSALASRALTRALTRETIEGVLGVRRSQLAARLAEQLRASCDELRLGVDVLDVGLEDVHLPAQVAGAWESMSGAFETATARRVRGAGQLPGQRLVTQAEADGRRRLAQAVASSRALLAKADADYFSALLVRDRAAPSVFRQERLLAALELATAKARKVVFLGQGQLDLDLSEKISALSLDPTDLDAPPKTSDRKE